MKIEQANFDAGSVNAFAAGSSRRLVHPARKEQWSMAIRLQKWISKGGLAVSTCACLLIHTTLVEAQKSHPRPNGDQHRGCPVTTAADAFAPAAPYKSKTNAGSFFFGTAKLWTLVHPNSWTGRKLVWWSPANDQNTAAPPALTVTFKRLDAPEPLRKTDHASWAFINDQPPFITTGIDSPPAAGCWQVTGRLADEELTYVVRL
jgi:hypothetical protein